MQVLMSIPHQPERPLLWGILRETLRPLYSVRIMEKGLHEKPCCYQTGQAKTVPGAESLEALTVLQFTGCAAMDPGSARKWDCNFLKIKFGRGFGGGIRVTKKLKFSAENFDNFSSFSLKFSGGIKPHFPNNSRRQRQWTGRRENKSLFWVNKFG